MSFEHDDGRRWATRGASLRDRPTLFILGAPAPLEFTRRQITDRRMNPRGVVVTEVLNDRLGGFGPRLELGPVHALINVPLADSIGALSQQSPLRLIDTVMPRAASTFR